jgi:hypothetical protein
VPRIWSCLPEIWKVCRPVLIAAAVKLGGLVTSVVAQAAAIRHYRKQYVRTELVNHIVVMWVRALCSLVGGPQ